MTRAPARMHPSGRLAFRRQVRSPRADALPLYEAHGRALSWEGILPPGDGPLECEIGCGKGGFLLAAASSRPGIRFLGVEAGPSYAAYCADRLARRGLRNAVLVADDARLFLADTVPPGAFVRIHVYYPDPWPKRRHRKRRFFQPGIAPLLHHALATGGELLIATDATAYFGEILALMGASPLFRRDPEREAELGLEVPGLAFGPTNFSAKSRAAGEPAWRAVYRALPANPEEDDRR